VPLIQLLCAVCGSNLAVLNPSVYIVSVVSRPAWRMLELIVQFVINQINEDYYYYYYKKKASAMPDQRLPPQSQSVTVH